MKFTQTLGVIALFGTLGGCVAPNTNTSAAPTDAPTDVMAFACIAAIEMHTNNHDIVVIGSSPHGSNHALTLQVGGTGIWTCVVTPSGTVQSFDALTSDGSNLA